MLILRRLNAGMLLAGAVVTTFLLLSLCVPALHASAPAAPLLAPPTPVPDQSVPADSSPAPTVWHAGVGPLAYRPAPVASTKPSHTLTLAETENILVLGMDYRPGGKMWRTDTIMVVAVDQIERKVGIVSIPRDLWVNIPGYGEGRINIADFYGEQTRYEGGGPGLMGQIIQDRFGITVHHWVRIQQEGLVGLVDTLGGVTVTLDCPLVEKTPSPTTPGEYEYLRLPAGQNVLDGITAKKFATFRYATTDFNRSRRQQQLIWAIRQRVDEVDLMTLIPQLWTQLADTFQTDLSLLDIFRYAALGVQLRPEDVRGLTVPRDALQGRLIQGSQVLVISDEALLKEALTNLFAAKPLAELGRVDRAQCR